MTRASGRSCRLWPAPYKRLKLPGGGRLEEAECCALAVRTIVQRHRARRAGRPQLKRDPLGSGLPGTPCANTVSVWISALSAKSPTSKRSPPAQAFGNSPGCGGAMAELGGESGRDGPKSSFRTELFASPSCTGTKQRA